MKIFGKEITFSQPRKNDTIQCIAPQSQSIDDNMSQVNNEPKREIKIKNYRVTGTSHYLDNIMCLSSENTDYDLSRKELIEEGYENEKIYQYDFYPMKTELVPEPDNPHDPNAVKVIVDDTLVGYIKAGSCSHILKIINENRIEKIESKISGGKYKYLGYDSEDDKYYLEKDESPFYVNLSIWEK